ncbi:MAG: recombinase family protein [Methylocella sp.]
MIGSLNARRDRANVLAEQFLGTHLCEIVDRLQAKGVAVRILNMNLDTNDATGKLMLQIGSIAEFERSIMFSQQLEGIAKPLCPVGGAVA